MIDFSRERTRRRLAFAGLYLCEGAPIGFLWWALPTILRERGAPASEIGSLSAWLVLAWAFKFLWAPLIDLGRGHGLRAWIVGAQVVMAAALLPLLWFDPAEGFGWIAVALALHALAAASQDAAIDSLAIRTTPADERGGLNGWMQLGMLTGRSLFGGGALLVRPWLGDTGLVLALSGGLLLSALFIGAHGRFLVAAEPVAQASPFGSSLIAALKRPSTLLAILFASISGAGFETVGLFAGPLLVDHGMQSSAVGWFFSLPAVAAMAVGALIGGFACDRFGIRRVVFAAGLFMGACVLGLAALARANAAPEELLAALTAIYLGIGLFTASTYTLFMSLTDPALGATQFSAYMGATNLCESWSAKAGGIMVERRGYPDTFAFQGWVGIAALVLLFVLRPRASAARTDGVSSSPRTSE
ncbi:MAG: MFS transporter [Planctomycetes bacterium]|nr:MFS transporter [Planctomycetota bacterium]